MFKKCVRCGGTIGAIPGGIWIEALKGEVCMTCYEEIAAASENIEPGQAPVIPPLEPERTADGVKAKGRRRTGAALEQEDARELSRQLERIWKLLLYIAVVLTVAVAALLLRNG